MADHEWPEYYKVTVSRPAWDNVTFAADRFDEESPDVGPEQRLAVDLGCGAGRDVRALLARGWRVLAVDQEQAAIDVLRAATPDADIGRLETAVADLESVELPACELLNASVSLQFVPEDRFESTVRRLFAAVVPGGRAAVMVYGDRDEAATDPEITCVPESVVRGLFEGFAIERWVEREEDGKLALGDPHHLHLFEVVGRKPR